MSDRDSQGYSDDDNGGVYSDDFDTPDKRGQSKEVLAVSPGSTTAPRSESPTTRGRSDSHAVSSRHSSAPLSSRTSSASHVSSSGSTALASSRRSTPSPATHAETTPRTSPRSQLGSAQSSRTSATGAIPSPKKSSPKPSRGGGKTGGPATKKKPMPKLLIPQPLKKAAPAPVGDQAQRLASLAAPRKKSEKPSAEEVRQQAALMATRRIQDRYLQSTRKPKPPPAGKSKTRGVSNGDQVGTPRSSAASSSAGDGGDAQNGSSVALPPGSFGYSILQLNIEAGHASAARELKDADQLLTQAYHLLQRDQPVPPPTDKEVAEEVGRCRKQKNMSSSGSESEDDTVQKRREEMYQSAISAYQKQKDPLLAMTLNNLGCLYRRLKQPSKASMYLDAGVRLERVLGKPSPITLLNAAVAATENKEFTHAQDLAKEALRNCAAVSSGATQSARTKMANIKTSIRYRIADAMFQDFKRSVELKGKKPNYTEEEEEVILDEADRVSEAFQKAMQSSVVDGGGDGSQTAFLRKESKKVRVFLVDFRQQYGGEIPWITKDDVVRLPGGLPLPPRAAAAYCRSQLNMVELGMKNSKKFRHPDELQGRPTHEFAYVGTTLAVSTSKGRVGGGEGGSQVGADTSTVKLPLIRGEEAERLYQADSQLQKPNVPPFPPPKRRAPSPMSRTKPSTARQTDKANVMAIRASQSSTARRASNRLPADPENAQKSERLSHFKQSPSLTGPIDETSILNIGKKDSRVSTAGDQAALMTPRSSTPPSEGSPKEAVSRAPSSEPKYSDNDDE